MLNDLQLKILNAFGESPRVLVRASRSTGRTTAACYTAILHAKSQDKQNIVIFTPTYNGKTDILCSIYNKLGYSGVRELGPMSSIELPNGSRIKVVSLPETYPPQHKCIKGKSADLVIIDNAEYVSAEHWCSLMSIILGDAYRRQCVKVLVLGTGRLFKNHEEAEKNFYYQWSKDPERFNFKVIDYVKSPGEWFSNLVSEIHYQAEVKNRFVIME